MAEVFEQPEGVNMQMHAVLQQVVDSLPVTLLPRHPAYTMTCLWRVSFL